MAVSYELVLLPHQWKEDGTNLYRLRITHNRKSRYIKTSIAVTRDDITKTGRIKTVSVADAVEGPRGGQCSGHV